VPPFFRELASVHLLVDDARGRGHPLDVARADAAPESGRVAVLDLALIRNRHGLETPVRVLADAARGEGGLEFRRSRVVEKEKRLRNGRSRTRTSSSRKAVSDQWRRSLSIPRMLRTFMVAMG